MSKTTQTAFIAALALSLRLESAATETGAVQLVVDSARIEPSTSKVRLSVRATNGSTEPVGILKPAPALVDKHHAMPGVVYVGVGERPYMLDVVQTGKCAAAAARAPGAAPQQALVTKRHMAFLAPNSEMDLGAIELDVDGVVFCPDAKFSFQLRYEPAFVLPTPEATNQIGAYIKARTMNPEAIRGLLPPDAKFLADMGFLPENANLFSGAKEEPPSIERYVESVRLMDASSKAKIASNTVAGRGPSDKAPAAAPPAAPKAKTKAKTGKK